MKKLLFITMLAACGGGSPVSSSIEVKDLTTAEATDECNYLLDTYPQKVYTCTVDGQTDTIKLGLPADACNDGTGGLDDLPDTCTATVGDLEDCLDGEYALSMDTVCASVASGMQPTLPASCAKIDSDDCNDDTTNRVSTGMPSMATLAKLQHHFAKLGR